MSTLRFLFVVAAFMFCGCASIDEGYDARYGLANPESSPGPENPAEEGPGIFGQRDIEEYDKKYREKDIFKRPEPEITEEERSTE